MRTVRTFGTERHEASRYSRSLDRIVEISTRYCAAYALYLTSSSFFFNATKVLRPSPPSALPFLREYEGGVAS